MQERALTCLLASPLIDKVRHTHSSRLLDCPRLAIDFHRCVHQAAPLPQTNLSFLFRAQGTLEAEPLCSWLKCVLSTESVPTCSRCGSLLLKHCTDVTRYCCNMKNDKTSAYDCRPSTKGHNWSFYYRRSWLRKV